MQNNLEKLMMDACVAAAPVIRRQNQQLQAVFAASFGSVAAQQGAAPDRLQLRSLRSFLTSLSALPAAGELAVELQRAAGIT